MRKKTETTRESQPRSPNVAFDATRNSVPEDAQDIIDLILDDHMPLKSLIETLKADHHDKEAKSEVFEEFAYLLTCHAKAEEESLYVAMKNYDGLKVESFEGNTEHGMADRLLHEINGTPDDNEWLAKVKVLAEAVEHHIEEEEQNILSKVRETITVGKRLKLGAEYTRLIDEYAQLHEIKTPLNVKFKRSILPPATRLSNA